MSNTERKIGFDRIRGQIAAHCTTQGGVRKLENEAFSRSGDVISRRLRLCDQMRTVFMMESGFPGGEYAETEHLVRKLEVEGAFLTIEEVLTLRRALASVCELVEFFGNRSEELYPDLRMLARQVNGYPQTVGHIDSLIDRWGKMKDSASPELYAIRRRIADCEGKAAKKLRQILTQAQSAGIVDADVSVSIRDGRAVIPVPAANKRKLHGFIQDESASGKTVYVEPAEVVELNNELRELEYDERREITRILAAFTDTIRPDMEGIERCGDYLTTVDMIRAKARFAIDNSCVMPIISRDGTLELRKARHPILEQNLKKEGRAIEPLDLTLTRNKHILVISGPNAGGKSVCLKTVGLLQWMFQCGVPVPALENSQLPVLDDIFIDIGDEQSIDNDLSTYSSHLLNMKRMLRDASKDSLVLIDEFGTGTEPVMGGAIAESILERLEIKGCYGVITTHYSNLKYYASGAKGVINGAMTFDVGNIRPLFRLEIGIPGSSFAIEIARKIGLPEDIIRSASEKAGNEHVNIERQLREIARDKRYWEQKRDRIRIADRKVEELEQKYEAQLSTIKQLRSEIIRQAKTDAERITSEANRQIESAIKTIRESQADKELTRLARRELDTFRSGLGTSDDSVAEDTDSINSEMERLVERRKRREERKAQRDDKQPVTNSEPPPVRTPVVGGKVRIEGQDTVGEVQSIKGRKATVAFGQMLTSVEISRLVVASNAEYKKQMRDRPSTVSLNSDISARKLNFKRHMDVRGMRSADALDQVRDFIDDAVMVGVGQVTILHGKGTGALKEEIRRYLRSVDVVLSAEDEHVDMGGSGITVVKLDL